MLTKKTILITLFLFFAGAMTCIADTIAVHEDDYENREIGSTVEGWLWNDNAVSHVGTYVDFEGSIVREETGTIRADINQRFGYKTDIELTGNTSEDPNDYFFEVDLRNLQGNWDPHLIEIFVLTKESGGDYGYGLPTIELYQADEWVHVEYNLGELEANNKTWWQGTDWVMTNPMWSYEIGGPPWPGVEAAEPWTQILLVDNLKISMLTEPAELAKKAVPKDQSIDVPIDIVLSWTPGDFADNRNLYFGTDVNDVNEASPDDPCDVLIYQGTTVTSYDPPGLLESNTTYYWRVDEINDSEPNSPWRGRVWSFTTGDFVIIDDFEAYNDINEDLEGSNRIYLVWSDGYANPNVNGSTIGYPAPDFANGEHFVETNIVYGGLQSGPFLYDNTTASYSEVTLPISTLGGDWTQDGINVLTLWFYGDTDNPATEQLYITVNNSKVVYSGDAADISAGEWIQWDIDLSDFNINLTNVTQLGIGMEKTGATGGEGMLFIDDIRLRRVEQEEQVE
jgi:hypothetical protein